MTAKPWAIEGVSDEAFDLLAQGLSGSAFQSLLLRVFQRRAEEQSPADVLAQLQRDPFCKPAAVDLRTSLAVDVALLDAAVGFEAVDLSPVAPLAVCSALAPTDQNRVLTALRGTEVVADPTNVLALLCALRAQRAPRAAVHLTTSQRVVRAQPVPKVPGYAQHFRIFVLASGGVEAKDHAFTVDTLLLHVRTMHRALDVLETRGYAFGARRVDIHATPARAAVGDRIAAALGPTASRSVLEHPYYSGGLRYTLWVTGPDGAEVPLVDGGAFDWLAKLTSNRRAVYIATGAGAQLIALRFARAR